MSPLLLWRNMINFYDVKPEYIDTIYEKAHAVYKIGTNKSHRLNYTCCDFKLLEEHYKEFEINEQVVPDSTKPKE